MMRSAAMVLAAALCALPVAVSAKDLGVRGATWPVAEPDLLAQIEARLLEMERSGALARLEQEARANARRKLEEPDAAPAIAPAREERSRLHGRNARACSIPPSRSRATSAPPTAR